MGTGSIQVGGAPRAWTRVRARQQTEILPGRPRGLVAVLALLVLSYWEPVEYAGIKFAILWKSVAILLLGAPVVLIATRRGVGLLRSRTSAWLAAMVLTAVCASVVDADPAASLRVAAQRLFTLAVLAYSDTASDRRTAWSCVVWLPIGLVISAAPFVLGLLTPIGESFRLSELYGFSTPGFVGVFQNAHAASLAMGLGVIVVLWRLFVEQSTPRLVTQYVLLGALAMLALQTYVRTGLAVATAGAFVLLLRLGRSKVGRVLALSMGVAAITIVLLPEDVTPLMNRLLGETVYRAEPDSRPLLDRASSGRLTFVREGLAAWQEAGPTAWLFGLGYGGMEQALAARVGRKIPTHNGFSDAVVATGLLGLVALLGFLWSLARNVAAQRDTRTRALGLALYLGWLAFLLVQGGEMPLLFLVVVVPSATVAAVARVRREVEP